MKITGYDVWLMTGQLLTIEADDWWVDTGFCHFNLEGKGLVCAIRSETITSITPIYKGQDTE